MAAKTRVIGGGIEVDGLAESIRALQKWDKGVRAEAVDIFRDEAKDVQKKAKRLATRAPGATGRTSWIGRSATGQGAGVKMNAGKNPRAWATEWGMESWHQRTWGGTVRGWIQSALRRRVFMPYQGVNFDVKGGSGPGYVIQAAIRRHLPGMEERVANRLQKLLTRELNRAGVPRG